MFHKSVDERMNLRAVDIDAVGYGGDAGNDLPHVIGAACGGRHDVEQRLIAAIRAGKGRIGLGDVMRVTGYPREKADPLMAKLMLDYDGDVAVSDARCVP